MSSEAGDWRQRWSLMIHRLKFGKNVAPGSRQHLEILRIEEERAEQMRKAMEERRRFGKY